MALEDAKKMHGIIKSMLFDRLIKRLEMVSIAVMRILTLFLTTDVF